MGSQQVLDYHDYRKDPAEKLAASPAKKHNALQSVVLLMGHVKNKEASQKSYISATQHACLQRNSDP